MRGGGVGARRPLAGSECGTDYGTPGSGPWPASYEAKRSESPDPGQNGGGVASSAQAALLRPPCVPPRARGFSTRAPAAAEDLRLPRNAALPISLACSHSPTPSPVGEVVQHLLPGAGGQVGRGQAGDGAVRQHARRARHGLGAGPPPVGALPIGPRHQGGVAAAAGRGGARPREARHRAAARRQYSGSSGRGPAATYPRTLPTACLRMHLGAQPAGPSCVPFSPLDLPHVLLPGLVRGARHRFGLRLLGALPLGVMGGHLLPLALLRRCAGHGCSPPLPRPQRAE